MRYPYLAYRQLFPEGQDVAPFDPVENGDHYEPIPGFFEWWYFDAAFEDGSYLVAVFHSSLFNATHHRPAVELHYYPQGGPTIGGIQLFDRAAFYASPGHCSIRIADCTAVDEGDHYRLRLYHDSVAAELTFWLQQPGCRAGTGRLFYDPSSGRHFNWVVPAPRARVEGELSIAGQTRFVVGTGYHDHNWGSVHLGTVFRGWTWGRVLADEWTVIFGDLVGRGNPPARVTPFVLVRDSQVLLTTDDVAIQGYDWWKEAGAGPRTFHFMELMTRKGPSVELKLTARRVIDNRDFPSPRLALARRIPTRRAAEIAFGLAYGKPIVDRFVHWLVGKGSYLRWETDYYLALPDEGIAKSGQMLCEVIAFE
jgi:hypothetical protein